MNKESILKSQKEVLKEPVKHILFNNLEGLEVFLKSKATEEIKKNLASFCAEHGYFDSFILLQQYNADYFSFNWCYKQAARYNHISILKHLLEDPKTDIFAEGHWAIKMAASYGSMEAIKLIFSKYESKQQILNSEAFFYASIYGHLDLLKYLIKTYNIDPSSFNNKAIIQTKQIISKYRFDETFYSIESLNSIIEYLWSFKSVKNTLINNNPNLHAELTKKETKEKTFNF